MSADQPYNSLSDSQWNRDVDSDDDDDEMTQSVAQVADIDRPDNDVKADRWG